VPIDTPAVRCYVAGEMNLYLISQTVNNDYDTFDAAVVCAPDEETARDMNPYDGKPVNWGALRYGGSWAPQRSDVNVKLLGLAKPSIPPGVVLASYIAG